VGARPIIELLYFEGCPNHEEARALVERVADEEGVTPDLHLVEVKSLEDAEAKRFLGSPSVRMNGHDVEPGADDRDAFVLACRIYRAEQGVSGQPDEEWVRAALRRAR